MGREKRTSRREQRKERKEREQAAALVAQQSAKKKRLLLILVPVVTLVVALGFYQTGLSHFFVGMVVLAGFFCWLGIGLGAIGSNVQARNNRGAGSINFGKRG